MNLRNPTYTYNFQTSQPLTQTQIEWLNNRLWENLPTDNDLEDIPEWTTEIKLDNVEELID
jgi:hypothetical protein